MRRKNILLWTLVFTLAARFAHAEDPQTLELKIKAAYLINFGRYVTFPDEVTSPALDICIVGEDPFGPILDRTVQGRQVKGRPAIVTRVAQSDILEKGCNIAYISPRLPGGEQQKLLAQLENEPVLTVGDSPRFLDAGGVVNFVYVSDTIRFAVNLIAARKARLDISSRVLAIAVSVRGQDIPE